MKAAADLAQPKTWKIYKVLGGDAALAKDKAGFLAKMEEATVNLILKGAIAHNSSFKKDWFDLKSVGPYNAQMVGLAGSPSQKWVKKYKKKRGVTPEMAAKAVYLYLVGLDKQKVF